ncbi:MAG: hypothetical protein K8T89_19420 [Planctomycetes bacterium]|nr:hypothetical protein [Planctomycetota bacterium]
MTTSPNVESMVVPDAPELSPESIGSEDSTSARLQKVEHEVAEFRDTFTRFSELVLGELKIVRQSHSEHPAMPASVAGDLPVTGAPSGEGGYSPETTGPRPWLLMELLREVSTTFRMYLDPRYRVRRSTQLTVPLILALFALNAFFFNVIFEMPFISAALQKIADVILAVLLYKVVQREIVRYRQVVAQLDAWHDSRDRTTGIIISNSGPGMTTVETE